MFENIKLVTPYIKLVWKYSPPWRARPSRQNINFSGRQSALWKTVKTSEKILSFVITYNPAVSNLINNADRALQFYAKPAIIGKRTQETSCFVYTSPRFNVKVYCGGVSQSRTNPDYILIMKPRKLKKDNSTVALHVNLAVTMHNLLSSPGSQMSLNKLIKTFESLSFRKRVWFVHGQGQNSERKHTAKFQNHLHISTMIWLRTNVFPFFLF